MSTIIQPESYFFDTVEHLLERGDLILLSRFVKPMEEEEEYVAQILQQRFEEERSGFPYEQGEFQEKSAVWAAKVVFIAAQLLILREVPDDKLAGLFPAFEGEPSIDDLLSADLCLRYLPEVIERAEDIDVFDQLITILDGFLTKFYYSGLGREGLKIENHWNDHWESSNTFRILFVERILERRAQRQLPERLKIAITPYIPYTNESY